MNRVTILKSSDKFLVLACEDIQHGPCVYKIAQRDNDSLHREVATLQALKERSRKIAPHLLPIYEHGTFSHGPYCGRAYYKQAYVDGPTLSQCIQRGLLSGPELARLFDSLARSLTEIALDDVGADWSEGATDTMRRMMLDEYGQLAARPHMIGLCRSDEGVVLNGRRHGSLRRSLDRILASEAFHTLDAEGPCLTTLGHWNFHGDNVLLSDPRRADGFRLIDPDVGWKVADPLLSVARFLYTFPHDTADYGQYTLQTDLLTRFDDETPKFQVALHWPEPSAQGYGALFDPFYDCNDDSQNWSFLRPAERFRLRYALLLCLLRGVNANYSDEIQFVETRVSTFRNKATYLFLRATEFASVFAASLERVAA